MRKQMTKSLELARNSKGQAKARLANISRWSKPAPVHFHWTFRPQDWLAEAQKIKFAKQKL